MDPQQAHQLWHFNLTFLTQHGEIIIGKMESHTSETITIVDLAGTLHTYPWGWVDIGESRNNIVHGTPYNTYDRKAKKLLIIGAGASHDFSTNPNLDYRPPLSNSIFKTDHFRLLNSYYPKIQEHYNNLAEQENLELKLLNIFNRAKQKQSISSAELLLELNYYLAQIFLLFSLNNKKEIRSNYLTLLNYINEYLEDHPNEEIVIINFNYDTLLDNAIEKTFGISYSDPNDYLGSEKLRIKMFKVHGSCNWIRRFVPMSSNKHYLENMSYTYNELPNKFKDREMHLGHIQNYLQNDIKIINFNDIKASTSQIRLDIGPYFPHLLIPMNEKDDFMIPRNQVNALKSSLKDINEIITIGWKGEEKALISLFENTMPKLEKMSIVDFLRSPSLFDISNFPFQNSVNKKNPISLTLHLKGFSGFTKGISNSEFSLFN